VGGKDAPAAGKDVGANTDVEDVQTAKSDLPAPPDAVPDKASDFLASDAARADLVAPVDLYPVDSAGNQPDLGLDAGRTETIADSNPEVGGEVASPVDFPCAGDSDCCVEVDSCMNVAYLYSVAPGAASPPVIQPSKECTACIPPSIEVRCVSGQCVGEYLSMGRMLGGHCGFVPLDGGTTTAPGPESAPPTSKVDSGTIPHKSVWGCGG